MSENDTSEASVSGTDVFRSERSRSGEGGPSPEQTTNTDAGADASTVAIRPGAKVVCRFWATLAILAWGAVVMPRWMIEAVHDGLGLDAFPDEPVAIYLARSASLLYGLFGLWLAFVSRDLVRYRPLIRFAAWTLMASGGVLMVVAVESGLPTWWIVAEGLSAALLGASLYWVQLPPQRSASV